MDARLFFGKVTVEFVDEPVYDGPTDGPDVGGRMVLTMVLTMATTLATTLAATLVATLAATLAATLPLAWCRWTTGRTCGVWACVCCRCCKGLVNW